MNKTNDNFAFINAHGVDVITLFFKIFNEQTFLQNILKISDIVKYFSASGIHVA